jgi:hypothetical protein
VAVRMRSDQRNRVSVSADIRRWRGPRLTPRRG